MLLAALLVLAGCSGSVEVRGSGVRELPPGNLAPLVDAPGVVRALIDDAPARVAWEAADPDGGAVTIRVVGLPPGLDPAVTSQLWSPTSPGTWAATLEATDESGTPTRVAIRFEARYRPDPDRVVALGDSVASGHGIELSDYVSGDSCFRAAEEAYGRHVLDGLVARGRVDGARAVLDLVACSGSAIADLTARPVPVPGGGTATQLDWALRANPGYVTLTVGANDFAFLDLEPIIDEEHGLDEVDVERRLEPIRRELPALLDTLVESTDATIAITGYYNPAAVEPQGILGCSGACFWAIAEAATVNLNAVIASAASRHPGRVVFVPLRERFAGHGAPNGVGPDIFRASGLGAIEELFGVEIEGVQAYCARGVTAGEPWLNSLDCVHPDGRGAREIAAAVIEAIG